MNFLTFRKLPTVSPTISSFGGISKNCFLFPKQPKKSFCSESSDPRKKDLPPRPSGQRPEPDRRGTGAFGQQFPFGGGGNFQFSFGIGGFPFGLFTFGNFGQMADQPTPVSPFYTENR